MSERKPRLGQRIIAAFVESPSSAIAVRWLESVGREVCPHGRNPCYLRCGVRWNNRGRWEVIPLAERRAWLDRNIESLHRDLDSTLREWTGPKDGDIDDEGKLLRPLFILRWPYGPPLAHEPCCMLRQANDAGSYCDCKACDASDTEWGVGA